MVLIVPPPGSFPLQGLPLPARRNIPAPGYTGALWFPHLASTFVNSPLWDFPFELLYLGVTFVSYWDAAGWYPLSLHICHVFILPPGLLLGWRKKIKPLSHPFPILPLSPEQDSTLVGSLSAYNYSYCRSFLLINSGLFGMDKNHIQSVSSSRFCKAKSLLSLTVGSMQLEFHSKR